MKMKTTEKYKCKDCGVVTTILTLGGIYHGCPFCGGQGGWLEKRGSKWVNSSQKTPELTKLNRFLTRGF